MIDLMEDAAGGERPQAMAVDVSLDGTRGAVGFHNGRVQLYAIEHHGANAGWRPKSNKLIEEPMKDAIEDLKFSGDGERLAVCSRDKWLCLFDITTEQGQGPRLQWKYQTDAVLSHLDWSADPSPRVIRANTFTFELIFFDAGRNTETTATTQILDGSVTTG